MKSNFPWFTALLLAGLLLTGCGSDHPSGPGKSPVPDPVTVTLDANPLAGDTGTVFTLSWQSSGSDSCTASGAWAGERPLTGSAQITPAAGTHDYALECSGPGGSAADTVTIVVTAAADPFAGSKAEFDRLRELETRTESNTP